MTPRPYTVVRFANSAMRVTVVVHGAYGVRKAKVYGKRKWITLPKDAEIYRESQSGRG